MDNGIRTAEYVPLSAIEIALKDAHSKGAITPAQMYALLCVALWAAELLQQKGMRKKFIATYGTYATDELEQLLLQQKGNPP